MAAGAAFAFTLFEGMAFRHMHDLEPQPEVTQILDMLKAIARLFSGGSQ
jgi:hypothetical protein